jgi:hypothetical protein
MSEEILKKLKHLIAAGIGDTRRLRDMLDTVKRGEPLVLSDFKYIEELTTVKTEQQDKSASPTPKLANMDESLSLLRIRLAEGSITIEEFRELKKAITED